MSLLYVTGRLQEGKLGKVGHRTGNAQTFGPVNFRLLRHHAGPGSRFIDPSSIAAMAGRTAM